MTKKTYNIDFFRKAGSKGGSKSRQNLRESGELEQILAKAREAKANKRLTKNSIPPTVNTDSTDEH